MHLQRAAFDGSAALEQLGQVDADRRRNPASRELLGEAGGRGGMDDVRPSETALSPST